MLVKTQFNSTFVNLDNIEAITIERPQEHTVAVIAEGARGKRYNLATVATRPEAERLLSALAISMLEGDPFFDFEEYSAARANKGAVERQAEKAIQAERARAAAKAQQKHGEHAATQGRKIKKQPEPLDWNNHIEEAQTARDKAEATAENADIIRCNYPEGAPGVIVTQTGAEIAEPADWYEIYMEDTPQGDIVINLVYRELDVAGDFQWDIIGIYTPSRAAEVFRDLRYSIETQRAHIEMPKK